MDSFLSERCIRVGVKGKECGACPRGSRAAVSRGCEIDF